MKNKFVLILISLAVFLTMGCHSRYYYVDTLPPQNYILPDYDAEIKSLNKKIEADPNNPENYILLGKAYAYKKQYEEACKQTEKALSLAPEKLDELKNDVSIHYWAVFFNAGLKNFENKYFNLAIERLQRSLDFEPKSAISMNLLARCYEKLKRDDEAEKTYKQAIELDLDYIDTYINLAQFYKNKAQIEEAEKILREAEEIVENPQWLQPENEYIIEQRKKAKIKIYSELGKLLLEKAGETEKVLSRMVGLSPEDILPILQKYTDAIHALKKVVSLDSLDKDAHFYLGLSYLKTEKYNEAIEAFTKVIEIDPEYCEAYLSRGYVHWKLGNKAAANQDGILGTECEKRQAKE